MKHKNLLIGICVVTIIIGFSIYSKERKREENGLPEVKEESLNFFKDNVIYENIITYAQEDINDDGKEDLVVVYTRDNKNETVSVVSSGESFYITEAIVAPREDVSITFKDIDEKDEIEVMISGAKNGNIGYAIYRIENKKMIDLFGEGMDACC
ncbi:MAG: Cys-Cys-COOH (seleno)protein SaoC [Paraclostridium sp.]